MIWRHITDWAKSRPLCLRMADRLGRGRGRFRFLDELNQPAPAPHRPDLSRWRDRELAAVWIGHATVLLRIAGKTILTDPVLSTRVGVGLGIATAGPTRFVQPALRMHELPDIDLVLISHAHFDHLDRPTLARLSKRIPIVVPHQNADLVRDLGFSRVSELRWGESMRLGGLNITAQQVNHWGARAVHDNHRGYAAFVLQSPRRRVLYGGDTAYCEHFRNVGRVDLAILGIGGYDPWIQGHANPEQVWAMANHARADFILPMHHSTFPLSYEPLDEPLQRLLNAAGCASDRIIPLPIGGMWTADN